MTVNLNDLGVEILNGFIVYNFNNNLYTNELSVLSVYKIGVDSIRVNIGNGKHIEMFHIKN